MTTPEAPPSGIRLLVVDDEESIRTALARFLGKRGYQVATAGGGEEALQALRNQPGTAVMLLDVRMPGMNGLDVVPEALEVDPDLAILMLSGAADATSAAISMQRGAFDYLTKPIELTDLAGAIDRALKRRDTLMQSRELSQWLKHEVAERTRELQHERLKLQRLSVATLEALIAALEAKDSYLSGHSARVAALSATIAAHMGLSDDEVEHVRTAARLHDLGKIGIRESVLNKQGPLTQDEYDHVKEHVVIGSQILQPLAHLGDIVAFVRGHHEHFDGSGYPDGLAGDAIPLGARIICASEIYDALTTARPYQPTLTPEEATDRMRSLTGKIVDPQVMDALATAVKRRQTLVFLDEEIPREA
ncbi:MAG TPA: HD domain-containing phosphohydrolase [Gemmatimonadales bacterium]|nr:HD domain-containing phosphohydrolase [Gemmatimonadales bacterium]